MRKLILSDNGITDAGAAALAQAAGLPRLDTVYLFRNPVSGGARAALEQAPHFCLGSLDLGERAEGYSMSTGETEIARRQYVRAHVLPLVGTYFRDHGRLQSAMLCVAQYWDDEANDAVHGTLIVSELFEPTLKVVEWGEESDPNVPHTNMKRKYGGRSSVIDLWGLEWDDNGGAIPLWAGFAPEGGHQEYSQLSEVYAPAVIFYRHGGYEFLPMCRPDLDGIRPEWGGDE